MLRRAVPLQGEERVSLKATFQRDDLPVPTCQTKRRLSLTFANEEDPAIVKIEAGKVGCSTLPTLRAPVKLSAVKGHSGGMGWPWCLRAAPAADVHTAAGLLALLL
jgi:hypothetical protein